MPDEGELIEAGTKGIAAGLTETFRELVQQFLGPLANEVGTGLGYVGTVLRLKLGLKMLARASQMLAEAGIEPRPVPPKLFLPILENASLEQDESLQERWAALLANAALPGRQPAVSAAFAEILKELSPSEVRLLDRLYNAVCVQIAHRKLAPNFWRGEVRSMGIREPGTSEDDAEAIVVMGNLERLKLVSFLEEYVSHTTSASITPFGFEFVFACRKPPAKGPPAS